MDSGRAASLVASTVPGFATREVFLACDRHVDGVSRTAKQSNFRAWLVLQSFNMARGSAGAAAAEETVRLATGRAGGSR